MDKTRWEQVQQIFHQASELAEPQRDAFLQRASGSDAALLAELRSMIAAQSDSKAFILDRSLDELAAEILGDTGSTIPTQEIGPYRLKRLLGEGGMGVVWLAERTDAGNLVAIKFLLHAGLSPTRQDRFAQEIRTLARLRHPYIARLYDAGTLADRTPWFVMEYVDGIPFEEYCRAPGRTLDEKLLLFRQVCEAVRYAHSQEIIHRDLKPSNIIVSADGTPRLLDFGIARQIQQTADAGDLTRSGIRFYSANYAAPEWITDGVVGFGTDVYSLGVILYEMLSTELPFANPPQRQDTPVEKPSQIVRRGGLHDQERISPATWRELDVLCLTAMRFNPAERYRSVEALQRDIDHYLKHEPLEARPGSLLYQTGRFLRRNRVAVVTTSAVLVLIIAMTAFFTLRLARARAAAVAEATRARRIEQFLLSFMANGSAPPQDLTVLKVLDRSTDTLATLHDDPETQAEIYYTLGRAYQQLNQLDKTDKLLELGLAKTRAIGGPTRQEAELLVQLAALRGDQAKYQDADRAIDLARAEIERLHLRNDDPLAGYAQVTYGKIAVQQGLYPQAISILQPLTALVPHDDDSRVNLIDALSYLAVARQYQGDAGAAESINRKALELERTVYGENYPQVAESLANIGTAEASLGHYADAEDLYRRASSVLEKYYGADNPETVQVQSFAGLMALHSKDYPEAEKLLRGVLPLQEREYGSAPNPNLAFTHDALGQLARTKGDLHTAEAEFEIASEMLSSLYGKLDLKTAQTLSNLGGVLIQEGQYTRAVVHLESAVKAFTQRPLPGNMNVPVASLRLGQALLGEKQPKEAERYLVEAYGPLNAGPPSFSNELADDRKDLAEVYKELHEPAKAQAILNGRLISNPGTGPYRR